MVFRVVISFPIPFYILPHAVRTELEIGKASCRPHRPDEIMGAVQDGFHIPGLMGKTHERKDCPRRQHFKHQTPYIRKGTEPYVFGRCPFRVRDIIVWDFGAPSRAVPDAKVAEGKPPKGFRFLIIPVHAQRKPVKQFPFIWLFTIRQHLDSSRRFLHVFHQFLIAYDRSGTLFLFLSGPFPPAWDPHLF